MALEERQAIADDVALHLLSKTYDELVQLADDENQTDAFLMEQGIDPVGPPHISLMVGRAGRLRKKICVEITVTADLSRFREQPGCVYFEKYSSGKLVVYGFRRDRR